MSNRLEGGRSFGAALAAAAVGLVLLLLAPAIAAGGEEEEDTGLLAAKGKITYRVYCSNCHGDQGRGDGSLADLLKVRPADLTRLAEANGGKFDREKVRSAIDGREEVRGHGQSDMPVWGEAFQNTLQMVPSDEPAQARAERKVLELTHFLEKIQAKTAQEEEPAAPNPR